MGGGGGWGPCALRSWESGGLRVAFAGHPDVPVMGMAAAGGAVGAEALGSLLRDVLESFAGRFAERLAGAGGGTARVFKGARALVWAAYRRAFARAASQALRHGAGPPDGGWLLLVRDETCGPQGPGPAERLRGSSRASPVVPLGAQVEEGGRSVAAPSLGSGCHRCGCFGRNSGSGGGAGPAWHLFRDGPELEQAVDSLLPGRHNSPQDGDLARVVLRALKASGGALPGGRAPGPEGAGLLVLKGKGMSAVAVRLPHGVAVLPLTTDTSPEVMFPDVLARAGAWDDLASLDALAEFLAAAGELPPR